jgi:hypothetical protein
MLQDPPLEKMWMRTRGGDEGGEEGKAARITEMAG